MHTCSIISIAHAWRAIVTFPMPRDIRAESSPRSSADESRRPGRRTHRVYNKPCTIEIYD